jgi:hypothetical protein
MRAVVGSVTFGWFLVGIGCPPGIADGGTLRFSGTKGGYRITVFTAPTPFRAGTVDISALILDASTGNPMTPETVTFRMTKPGSLALEYPATTEAATNKLFRAAQFELPEPGRWELQVEVDGSHGPAVLGGEVEAAAPLPRWQEMWLWIGWPVLAIALFSIHVWMRTRRPS